MVIANLEERLLKTYRYCARIFKQASDPNKVKTKYHFLLKPKILCDKSNVVYLRIRKPIVLQWGSRGALIVKAYLTNILQNVRYSQNA
jgi:hypothetical protein